MNAELSTIIANIGSQLEQLKQMTAGGGDDMAKADVMAPEKKEDGAVTAEEIAKILKELEGSPEDEKEDEKEAMAKSIKKAVSPATDSPASSADGSTGSSDAKEIVDDQGETNEKNIAEVAKAIVGMLKKNKTVQKSADTNTVVVQAVKALADELSVVRKGLENIYEGLGVADQVKQSMTVQKSEDRKPAITDPSEVQKSIEAINRLLGREANAPIMPQGSSVAKSLSENNGALLSGLFPLNSQTTIKR